MSAWSRAFRFYAVGAAGMGLQLGTLAGLVGWFDVHYGLAAALALAVTLVHNFVWHVRWTWKDTRPAAGYVAAFLQFVAGNGGVSIVGTALLMPLLAGWFGLPAVAANTVTIVVCGVLNFWLANRVFSPAARPSPVVSELQLDAEVAGAQGADRVLQVVLRRR